MTEISHEVYLELLRISHEVGYGVKYVAKSYIEGMDDLMSLEGVNIRPRATEDGDINGQLDDLYRQVEVLKTAQLHTTERVAHDFDHWRTQLNNRREQWFDDGIAMKANREKIQDLLAFMISHREIVKDQAGAISDHTEMMGEILRRLQQAETTIVILDKEDADRDEALAQLENDQAKDAEQLRNLCIDLDTRWASLTTQGNSLVYDITLLSDAQAATAKRMGIQEKHTEVTIGNLAKHDADIIVLQELGESLQRAGKKLKGIVDTAIEYGREARGDMWTKIHDLVGWQDEALPQIRSLQVQDEVQAKSIPWIKKLENEQIKLYKTVEAQARDITWLNRVEADHAERLRDLENSEFGAVAHQDTRKARESMGLVFVDSLSSRARRVYSVLVAMRQQGKVSTGGMIGTIANVTGGNLTRVMRELHQAEAIGYAVDSRGHIDYSSVELL
jgi:hypothetical protein